VVWYDATYVVAAVTATGEANVNVCHPVADSPLNVPVANNVPDALHKLPACEPVLPAIL
jgi:hypothetical protein